MAVDAKVYRWHSAGMTTNQFMTGETYVTVSEAERMIEAAYKRGYEQGQFKPSLDTAQQLLRAEGYHVS